MPPMRSTRARRSQRLKVQAKEDPRIKFFSTLFRAANCLPKARLERLAWIALERRHELLELGHAVGRRGVRVHDRDAGAIALHLREHLQDAGQAVRAVAGARR